MAPSLAAISSAFSDLAAVPWLEEAFIIASIGVAFILTHKVGVASVRRPAKDCKLAWAEEEEEAAEEEEGASRCPSRMQTGPVRRVRDPERRDAGAARTPQTSAEMPGVTDRRFLGSIVSYKEDEGYGFISCPALYQRFGRDVFLHRLQVGAFGVGAWVSFGVFLNKNGQPQAKDLEAPPPPPTPGLQQWGGWGPCVQPFGTLEPVAKRQPLNPHAKPFQTQAGPGDYSSTTEPEATWTRRPSSWKEWSDSKQSCDQDVKGGEKRRVPKAKWVAKKVAASGSADEQ